MPGEEELEREATVEVPATVQPVKKNDDEPPRFSDPETGEEIDLAKPKQWAENGPIEIDQPEGIWKVPTVYGNKNVLRFPLREKSRFKRSPVVDKYIDPLVPVDDPAAFTARPPQTTAVPQTKGPPFHYQLHRSVTSGDKDHFCRIVDPEGRIVKKKGCGWLCRKWVERPMPRDLLNHSEEEWADFLAKQAEIEARDEAVFQELMRSIFSGMGNEDGIMKETNEMLSKEKNSHDDRLAAMYKLWEQQVFHNINDQIDKKLMKLSPDEIMNKLRYQQMCYAKEAMKRPIYRDYPHMDYDPFELQGTGVHYSNAKIFDPVKHDLLKDKREKVLMGDKVFDKAMAREILEPPNWPYAIFRSTMHGHINADEEDATYKPREMIPEKWHSREVFWNGEWGSECWNEAFPPGGKGMPPRPPDNKEGAALRGKDMVWDSPVKLQPKLQLSEENPWF